MKFDKKFTVIKNENIAALDYSEREQLLHLIREINNRTYKQPQRFFDSGHNPNKYLVINTDESYANQVAQIMKEHGHDVKDKEDE